MNFVYDLADLSVQTCLRHLVFSPPLPIFAFSILPLSFLPFPLLGIKICAYVNIRNLVLVNLRICQYFHFKMKRDFKHV